MPDRAPLAPPAPEAVPPLVDSSTATDRAAIWPVGARPSPELLEVIASHHAAHPGDGRWMPSRLVLVNYWVFEWQEFHFVDGRLVLHGANGSGKTSALVAALPLALWGERTKKSVDATGVGRGQRSLEYYLLGSKDDDRDNHYIEGRRTSYVALEFMRWDGAGWQYLTIGQGLQAARRGDGQPHINAAWGLILADGTRLGPGGHTLRAASGHFLDRAALKALLETPAGLAAGNRVTMTQEDYRRTVGRLLYSTDDVEAVDALVGTLTAFRTPMLNTQKLGIEQLGTLLAQSLPPLDTSAIGALAQNVHRLDQLETSRRETDALLTAVAGLDDATGALVTARALEAALATRDSENSRRVTDTLRTTRRRDLAEAERTKTEAEQAVAALEHRQVDRQARRDLLQRSDAQRLVVQADDLARAAEIAERERANARRRADTTANAAASVERTLAQQENMWRELRDDLARRLTDFLDRARVAQWPAPGAMLPAIHDALATLTVSTTDRLDDRPIHDAAEGAFALTEALERLATLATRREAAEAERGTAQGRVQERAKAVESADDQRRAAEAARDAARGRLAGVLRTCWTEAAGVGATPMPVEQLLAALGEGRLHGDDVRAALAAAYAVPRQVQQDVVQEATFRLTDCHRTRDARAAEVEALRVLREATPPTTSAQAAARAALEAAGIPALPLYAVVDPHPTADPAAVACVEQTLDAMGLLTALVVVPERVAEALAVVEAAGVNAGDALVAAHRAETATPAGGLGALLTPAETPLGASAVTMVLAALGDPAVAAPAAIRGRRWTQGVLTGVAAADEAQAQYLGATARAAARARRLAAAEALLADAETDFARAEEGLRAARAALAGLEAAERAAQARLTAPLEAWRDAGRVLEERRRALHHAEQTLAAARAALREAERRLMEAVRAHETAAQPYPTYAQARAEQCRQGKTVAEQLHRDARDWLRGSARLRAAAAQWAEYRTQRADLRAQAATDAVTIGEADARATTAAAQASLAKEAVAAAGALDVLRELEQLTRELAELPGHIRTRGDARAVAQHDAELATLDIQKLDRDLPGLEEQVRARRDQLRLFLMAHPRLAPAAAVTEAAPEDPLAGIDLLVAATPDATDGERSLRGRGNLARTANDDIERRRMAADQAVQQAIRAMPNAVASRLRPEFGEQGLPVVWDDVMPERPAVVRTRLEARREQLAAQINAEEQRLVEEFLLDGVGSALHRALLMAGETLTRYRAALEAVEHREGERLLLDWELRPDPTPQGQTRAAIVRTLQERTPQLAAEGKREELKEFLLAELTRLRRVRDDGRLGAEDFVRLLAAEFDYREWFRVIVLSQFPGKKPKEITPAAFAVRSSGQRVVALVAPILAAVAAHTDALGPTAPRFVGFDEAFAGVDLANQESLFDLFVRFQMRFLMTSDQLKAMAETLPGACTMVLSKRTLRDKPSLVTARALIWTRRQLVEDRWLSRGLT